MADFNSLMNNKYVIEYQTKLKNRKKPLSKAISDRDIDRITEWIEAKETRDYNKQLKAEKQAKLKRERMWRTSIMGVSIATRTASAYMFNSEKNIASTDMIAQKQQNRKAMMSLATMAIGTFGGPYGAVIASMLSTYEYFTGNARSNAIQRRGDASKVAYAFNNRDVYKYGTQAYDNGSGEWVSKDAEKIKSRILGNKKSV